MAAKRRRNSKVQTKASAVPHDVAAGYASFDSKLGRVCTKGVEETLERWSAYPPTILHPGAPPQERVGDLVQLQPLFNQAPKNAELREDVTGVRDGVLHESLFLLHKSCHVASICTDQLLSGRLTWAEVDAYQASFFAMGSILGFLGIVFPKQNFLMDVWPSAVKGQRAQSKGERPNAVQIIRFQHLDHYHRWAILQRVLKSCESGSFAWKLGNAIYHQDKTTFAKRRNSVNYESGAWLHLDLFDPLQDPTIGRAESEEVILESLRQVDQHYSFFLMLALVCLAHSMARSVGELIAVVREDIALLLPQVESIKRIWDRTFENA